MATDTDIRLKSYLDSNQRDREQMCRSVLALSRRYSDVLPRHPLGGPDGGRDIEAVLDGERVAYGAVGFKNGANDSEEQKKEIRAKFSDDLKAALSAKPDLKAFAFLTNLRLTMGEQSEMKEQARKAGIEYCELFDRERLRIELDSPGGFFIRFQHLGIPLSEAEQASFLARYGDRIQQVVSTGFQKIERTLGRILFLQESSDVLHGIYVRYRLKESYLAAQIGHFRAFVYVSLRAIKHDIHVIWFGASDKSHRFDDDPPRNQPDQRAGIAYGIGHGQWEQHVKLDKAPDAQAGPKELDDEDKSNVKPKFVQVGSANSIGMDPVSAITIHYRHDDPLIRFRPRLQLRDLDDCTLMPVVNLGLAEKLHSMEVFANGYKLAHVEPNDFIIDKSRFEPSFPSSAFAPEELRDPWVRIRPLSSSAFDLRFTEMSPRRMFDFKDIPITGSD